MNRRQILAYIGLFGMTLIIGLSFIFVKIGLEYSNSVDLLAYRFTSAFFIIVILWFFNIIDKPRFNFKRLKSLILLSLFYPLLFFLLQTYGLEYTSASEAGIIFASTPIVTIIFARIFLKEKTTFLQKLGVILSVAGILYILYQKTNFVGSNTNGKGVILLLLSVTSIVMYYIFGKKVSMKFTAVEMTIWITIIAFIVFNSWSIISHVQQHSLGLFFSPLLETDFIWAILYLGILSSVFTSFLTNYALPVIPASQIAIFNNLSPIIAVIGGVVFLNETLYSYHIIGGILVIIGIIFTMIFSKKESRHT